MVSGNRISDQLSLLVQAAGGAVLAALGVTTIVIAVNSQDYAFVGLGAFMVVMGAAVAWVNLFFFGRARRGASIGSESLRSNLGPLARLLIPAAFLTLLGLGFIPAALEKHAYVLVAVGAAVYLYVVPYMIRKYLAERRKSSDMQQYLPK